MAFNNGTEMTERKLTDKDLTRMAWRSFFLQASFNYERMQGGGFLFGMLPALKKVCTTKEKFSAAMKRHLEFFNINPYFASFMMGLVLALEEKEEDPNLIRSTKIALMGPLGGIGDVLFHFSLLPIAASIGASLSMEGNILGPFVLLIVFNVCQFLVRFNLGKYSYKLGLGAIDKLTTGTKDIEKAMSILGIFVSGGLIASYVRLSLPFVFIMGEKALNIQTDVIDKLCPNILPLMYTFLMFWMLNKKYKPITLILTTIGIGLVLGLFS